MMPRHCVRPTLLLALAAACAANGARAFINPNFTPNNLMDQASQILVVRMQKPDAANRITLEVVAALKGKKPDGALTLDLSATAQKEWAKQVGELAAKRGGEPVPMFIGSIREETPGAAPGEAAAAEEVGLLQLDRDWVVMNRVKGNDWAMSNVDVTKQGIFDGGADMLIAAAKHILAHPDDLVPVAIGCEWEGSRKLGKVEGAVSGMQAVDLDGKGAVVLHVASAGGDRLQAWDKTKKAFADVTAARKLAAKSRVSVWADLTGDGLLDLVGWDGAALRLHAQAADGTFGGAPVDLAVKPEGGCLSLAALDVGTGKRAGLLVGTAGVPLLVKPDDAGYKSEPLPAPEAPAAALGKASPLLVADLDNDGIPDVCQPFEQAGLIYKGKAPGAFAAPIKKDMGTQKDPVVCCAGDFDTDGLLDIYAVGASGCFLWNNRGGLNFVNTFGHTGEMSYTAQPGGVSVETCDINNDGLPDLFIAMKEGSPANAQLYFNRGFRSFGKALGIVWQNDDFMTATSPGQQAGTVADLNGDGAQDVAVVALDGTLTVFLRAVSEDGGPLFARVALGPSSATAGPVTVTGWNSTRCIGARNVTAGSPSAIFGLKDPGQIKLQWTLPSGKVEKKVDLETTSKVVPL